jgi:hypothetical protein
MSNIKGLVIVLFFALLISCGSQGPTKNVNKIDALASALSFNNITKVHELLSQVKLTENTQNLIELYLKVLDGNPIEINARIAYIEQFRAEMSFVHITLLNEVTIYNALLQIYRQEISPPVRILQREQLYLAPSRVDFNKCPLMKTVCAISERDKLKPLLTDDEITKKLKKMALKDPCVNLSNSLQDEVKANRCLRKSKGGLKVVLLATPRLETKVWLQILSEN